MKIKFKGRKTATVVTLHKSKNTGGIELKINGSHAVYLLTSDGSAEVGIDEALAETATELIGGRPTQSPC